MSLITLIVDDDPVICKIHVKLFQVSEISPNPLIFSNGLDALNTLLEIFNVENEYLIFLDINMPVMSGWTFLDEVGRRFTSGNIHVIVVTSSIDDRDRKKAYSYAQVVNFMEKPLTINDLKQLKQLLAQKEVNIQVIKRQKESLYE